MPYKKGKATSLQDLLDKTVAWVTDTEIHGADAWELVRNDPWPRGTIFKAKGVNGINSCYIGIMLVTHVKGSSYRNWLLQTKNLTKHLIRSTKGLGLMNAPFIHTEGADNFSVITDMVNVDKNRIFYYLSDLEIVEANGNALAFGVFKQYVEDFDWNEQPGAIEFGELYQWPIKYSHGGSTYTDLKPPIYPGVGYPGIGMPSGEPASGFFDYWLTKDASRITIAIKNNSQWNGTQWDMAHAGMLVPFHAKMQYAFPAVVAGSCIGLQPLATVASGINGKVTKGSKIDYSYYNTSLARSMPTSPCIDTSNYPADVSQIGVCMPDGRWKFFSNWTQMMQTNENANGTKYFTLSKPVRQSDTGGCRLKPTNHDIEKLVPYTSEEITMVTMEALDLWHESAELGTTDMLGSLWHLYCPGIDHSYGEITIDNIAYLLLPNCWEGRLWYIPTMKQLSDLAENPQTHLATGISKIVDLYNDIIHYNDQFRLLIRLED